MSLINDALKRARQFTKKESPPAPGSETPLQPVENEPKKTPTRWGLVGAVVLLGLAGWLFMNWWSARSGSASSQATAPPRGATNRSIASRMVGSIAAASNVVRSVTNLRHEAEVAFGTTSPPVAAPSTAMVAVAAATHQGAAPVVTARAEVSSVVAATDPKADPASESTNAVVAQNGSEVVPSSRPASATRSAVFPPLKLQGIYYRIARPSALINNRTLFVGDEIEGVRIMAIERFGVTIELGGKTKELSLK